MLLSSVKAIQKVISKWRVLQPENNSKKFKDHTSPKSEKTKLKNKIFTENGQVCCRGIEV